MEIIKIKTYYATIDSITAQYLERERGITTKERKLNIRYKTLHHGTVLGEKKGNNHTHSKLNIRSIHSIAVL